MKLEIQNQFNTVKQGDTKTEFKFQLFDFNDDPLDLTGKTLNVIIANATGKILEKTPVVEDAATGVISFKFLDSDVTGHGSMRLEVHVTDGTGETQIIPSSGYYKFVIDKNLNDLTGGVTSYTLSYFESQVEAKKQELQSQVDVVQSQVDQLVVEGDSSVEAAQARVKADGTSFTTLRDRLNSNDALLAEKASGTVFRYTQGGTAGSEQVINVIEGYEGNGIASDLRGCTIAGGGGIGYENVIGSADTANVGTTTPKTPNLTGTNAHYAVIGGGYDNVNNALAGVLTGFHCLIESAATHGTINGGSYHKILDGDYSVIGGGTLNEINVVDGGAYAVIGGGHTNKVTGKYGTVAGGYLNQANGERSMVLGGSNNIASAYGSSISGGFSNTASGNQSVVTNGQSNTASGSGAAVFGGRNNVASGIDSMITGGAYNEATSQESIVRGLYGKSTTRGQQVTGGGRFSLTGDAQESKYVLRRQTTDATTANLGVDGAGVVPTITNNGAWIFSAQVVAKSGADIKAWKVEGIFYKDGTNGAAFLGTPTVTVVGETAGASAWTVGTLAGSATLNLRITGEAARTINWVGKIETVEVIA